MHTFYTELHETSKNFKDKQNSFLSGSKFKVWLRNTRQYKETLWDKKPLYINGQVVYASLVQANSILFKKHPAINCPAAIVFSYDEYYKHHPRELHKISNLLFSYKDKTNIHNDIKEITDAITDEYKKLHNVPIPTYLTEGRQLYYTTIMVYRCHLPKGYIVSSLFPIVSDFNKPKETYILPRQFWTKPLQDHYLRKSFLQNEVTIHNANLH